MHCMIKETFFFIIHTYTHAHFLELFSLILLPFDAVELNLMQSNSHAIQFPVENTFTYIVHSITFNIDMLIYL